MKQIAWWIAMASIGAVLVAGCGEVKGDSPPDGPTADGPPAPPAPVKVTVLTNAGDGLPDLTAKVLFLDGAGTVVFDGAVDSQGRAEAALPNGGSVSAIRVLTDTPTARSAFVSTTLGVKPGDDLTFGIKPPPTILNQGGQTTMTANFTMLPAAQAPATYQFITACGATTVAPSAPAVATLTFRDSCHGANFDMLVVASGGALTAPMFIKVVNITHQNGTAFNVLGGFSTMSPFTVNMSNIPDVISTLNLTRSSMIDGVAVAAQPFASVDPPAGDFSASVPFPQTFGTRSQISVTLGRADATNQQQHEVRTPTLSQPVAIDLGKLQLPWITALALQSTGLTWTTVAAGDAPDGMVATWFGRWTDGTRTTSVVWRIAQPGDAAGATLPKLPSAYAAFDPSQQTVTITPTIGLISIVDYASVPSYDEFRRMPETLVSTIASLGAFVNLPLQRRITNIVTRLGVSGASE
jgi:hypothetical protein